MNIVNKSIVLASVALSSAATASEMYFGGNIVFAEHTEKYVKSDLSFNLVEGTLGNQINDYFAVEVRAGVGIKGEKFGQFDEDDGLNLSIDMENFYGLFVKTGNALNEVFYPYAIAGFAHYNYTSKFTDPMDYTPVTYDSSISDISLGLGMDIKFNGFTINVEYLNRYDKYDAKLNGLSVGLSTRF